MTVSRHFPTREATAAHRSLSRRFPRRSLGLGSPRFRPFLEALAAQHGNARVLRKARVARGEPAERELRAAARADDALMRARVAEPERGPGPSAPLYFLKRGDLQSTPGIPAAVSPWRDREPAALDRRDGADGHDPVADRPRDRPDPRRRQGGPEGARRGRAACGSPAIRAHRVPPDRRRPRLARRRARPARDDVRRTSSGSSSASSTVSRPGS